MTTLGLGAQISSASDSGNTLPLLLSTIVMAMLVVCVNRLVWRPLYRPGGDAVSAGRVTGGGTSRSGFSDPNR